MIHIHDLGGCAPAPLAHYLKALGILRLVSEQADAHARGWWEGERFRLASILDESALRDFLLERYEPIPVFNPWGARSGFYPDNSETTARGALEDIEKSKGQRFKSYRQTIATIRAVLHKDFADKKPPDDEKGRFVLALRRQVRGRASYWLDAVLAVTATSDDRYVIRQPALFGTGGNEGSGGYASAYMSGVSECLLKRRWDHALESSLFSSPLVNCEWTQSMGQFLPEGSTVAWDFLFAFEGACMVRSAVTAKQASEVSRWMSSPFYVAPSSFGYASASRLDEFALNKGKELPGRGEQWFPMWAQPMLFAEVAHLFAEGRASTRRGRAIDGWSMARAATSLGVRSGITQFVRYGYLQRNNLATHFAVPLGRVRVPDRVLPILACLDDLDHWMPGLLRQARDKDAPSRLRTAVRRLAETLLAVTQHPDEPSRWQSVLMCLADVETVMASGSGCKAQPVPALRPQWAGAAADGSAEFRLALALALQTDAVRRHWLPLDRKQPARFATTGTGAQIRLARDTAVVMHGRSGIDDALALVERRLVEAAQRGARHVPLLAAPGAFAYPCDLAAWLAGAVNTDRTLALARALMALDAAKWSQQRMSIPAPDAQGQPADGWMAIRLALLPWPLPDGRDPGADPAIFRRLASGDAATAFELARRRLRARGIHSTVRSASISHDTTRLWAAAMAFPITPEIAATFARRTAPTTTQENPQ